MKKIIILPLLTIAILSNFVGTNSLATRQCIDSITLCLEDAAKVINHYTGPNRQNCVINCESVKLDCTAKEDKMWVSATKSVSDSCSQITAQGHSIPSEPPNPNAR